MITPTVNCDHCKSKVEPSPLGTTFLELSHPQLKLQPLPAIIQQYGSTVVNPKVLPGEKVQFCSNACLKEWISQRMKRGGIG